MDVQLNIGAEGVGENLFEVVLKIDVKSKSSDGTAFVIELQYAGLFGVRNVPEDQLQPFFLAEAPRILFPFARRVIADAVRSEEHTSELQSLMRISYAVFCLKKNNTQISRT